MSDYHRTLLELLQAGRSCATATLVDSTGSSPGKLGHRMIVLPDRSVRFTIGGGPLEAMVIGDCLDLLARGENAVKEYRLVPEGEGAVGMVCGGMARVFIEAHLPAPTLMVFGAGHVGREVIRKAEGLGFRRRVADDRAEYLLADEFPADVERIHCPDSFRGDLPEVDAGAFVVIVTRCHETDREILARLASQRLAYLGMIGSRRKVAAVREDLEGRGIPRERLAHLHAPIGLEIGARSPQEIALSILAEIVAVRSGAADRGHLARAKSSAGPAR
jgi:xanthine dehydrogenase accessory factor